MQISTLFFDLDDTLYPAESRLWTIIKERIGMYMLDRLNIPAEQVQPLRKQFFEQYGTTLRGLQAHYTFEMTEFLAFVHDVPLTDYIQPDPLLRSILQGLPIKKFIFTNADANHARRVLRVLELEDCFDGIIDVVAIDPYCKPMPQSFKKALDIAGETESGHCAMIDDLPRTTLAARQFGIYSILFGAREPNLDADAILNDWAELPELLKRRI